MLRIINKQAQALSVQDDAELMRPYSQVGNLVKDTLRDRKRSRQRQKWEQQQRHFENMRDSSNGLCESCGLGMVKTNPNSSPFCPSCYMPSRSRIPSPRLPR